MVGCLVQEKLKLQGYNEKFLYLVKESLSSIINLIDKIPYPITNTASIITTSIMFSIGLLLILGLYKLFTTFFKNVNNDIKPTDLMENYR